MGKGDGVMNLTWIKLAVDILDDAKIKIIRSHPDGNSIVVLWIGLLCLAMKSARPGIIEISDGIPYTIDDLSSAFNIEKKTVELGLALFAKYRMIDLFDGNTIEVINFSKHQSLERIEEKRALNRARVKEFREKRRCNALLTHESRNVTLTDKNKNKKENKNIYNTPAKAGFVLPDWIPEETWKAYLAVRNKKKAANTEYALTLIIKKLEKLKPNHIAIINQSITAGWVDMYPLKEANNANTSQGFSTNSYRRNNQDRGGLRPETEAELDRIAREYNEHQAKKAALCESEKIPGSNCC
jgi:predicted phage replisome organizer